MLFSKALFYPTIDIHDEEWLKTAYLFWDEISTIVPQSMVGMAYQNNTSQFLEGVKFLKPYVVNPDSRLVMGLVKPVKTYAKTAEGKECLMRRVYQNENINPYDDRRAEFYLHHEKLPFELQRLIADKIGDDGWARVSENFADYYMTLLANQISRDQSLTLLTASSPLANLSTRYGMNHARRPFNMAGRGETEAIRQAMLLNMVIDGIRINPLTSIEDLYKFKERHQQELKNFRNGFDDLSNLNIPPDISEEGLGQYVRDIYENRFLGAYNDLKVSLHGAKIGFIESIGALAFTDVSTRAIEAFAVLPKHVEYAIGAGAYFGLSLLNRVKANNEIKRRHRMSYLLSIERELR